MAPFVAVVAQVIVPLELIVSANNSALALCVDFLASWAYACVVASLFKCGWALANAIGKNELTLTASADSINVVASTLAKRITSCASSIGVSELICVAHRWLFLDALTVFCPYGCLTFAITIN